VSKGGQVVSFNQQNYINNFNKKTYKSFLFRVRKDDEKILKKLAEQEAINKYLTDLVRKDIDSEILTLKEIKDRIRPVIDKHNADHNGQQPLTPCPHSITEAGRRQQKPAA
jgi:Fic family protein